VDRGKTGSTVHSREKEGRERETEEKTTTHHRPL